MLQDDLVLGVSDFVALLNQTLEYAYPSVVIVGELANLRVSKNKWVYFDLKDESSSVKFFGTVYQLPGPLEDGLMVQVRGLPRLHQQFGFSVTVQAMQPVGEGSLKKAAALLEAKLAAEGLFDPGRKRQLPYPPQKIGLVTSAESAAYKDFVKILRERWGGVEIVLADVQVQGESAPGQVVRAIEHLNAHEAGIEVIVVTRGGGSADDLAAFSTEQVVRAVAASRIPTLVAIGHEIDTSLAELAADLRASTPSNAAELLVPDKKRERQTLHAQGKLFGQLLEATVKRARADLDVAAKTAFVSLSGMVTRERNALAMQRQIMLAYNPEHVLKRGYAIVRSEGKIITSYTAVKSGAQLDVQLRDGIVKATAKE